MATRHEEKYIISYRQYAELKSRAMQLLTPDSHGKMGNYVITSLYYDDPLDHALYEKLDGLPEHRKFRIRTYDCTDRIIKLERKDKHGILTEKTSASLTREEIPLLDGVNTTLSAFSGTAFDLAAEIQSTNLRPVVTVRYTRDAFFFQGTDLRLTFDTNLEVIEPNPQALFSESIHGLPVLDANSVIMEVKYGKYVPSFVRKFTSIPCKQLSVSKYALCREACII
jgi:SPX domain protein involved in polyphosphate accumulation